VPVFEIVVAERFPLAADSALPRPPHEPSKSRSLVGRNALHLLILLCMRGVVWPRVAASIMKEAAF
jgi:hypothetical protein